MLTSPNYAFMRCRLYSKRKVYLYTVCLNQILRLYLTSHQCFKASLNNERFIKRSKSGGLVVIERGAKTHARIQRGRQDVWTPPWKITKLLGSLAILVLIPWKITKITSQHNFWAVIGLPPKLHLNGVSLAGH